MDNVNIYILLNKNKVAFRDNDVNKIYFTEESVTTLLKKHGSNNLTKFKNIRLKYIDMSNININSDIIKMQDIDDAIVSLSSYFDNNEDIIKDYDNPDYLLLSYVGLLLILTSYQHKELKTIYESVNRLHSNLKVGR